MGYLTTFTLYNDALRDIEKDPAGFVQELVTHAAGCREPKHICLRGQTVAIAQRPRHADESVIYVQMGNQTIGIVPYSDNMEELIREHPEFAKKIAEFMRNQANQLEKQIAGKPEFER